MQNCHDVTACNVKNQANDVLRPTKQARPYGTWSSPLTASKIRSCSPKLSQVAVATDYIYYLSSVGDTGPALQRVSRHNLAASAVPYELCIADGPVTIGCKINVYGGRAWSLGPQNEDGQDTVVCNDLNTGQLCWGAAGKPMSSFKNPEFVELMPVSSPKSLTAQKFKAANFSYGAPVFDPVHQQFIALGQCDTGAEYPRNFLATFALSAPNFDSLSADDLPQMQVLASGADFYNHPTVSPSGHFLAWIEWDIGQMPWDDSRLCLSYFDANGRLGPKKVLAKKSAFDNPLWLNDDTLVCTNEQSGYSNIYKITGFGALAKALSTAKNADKAEVFDDACRHLQGSPVHIAHAEFSWPAWNIGVKQLAKVTDTCLLVMWQQDASTKLGLLNVTTGSLSHLPTKWQPSVPEVQAQERTFAFIGASPDNTPCPVVGTLEKSLDPLSIRFALVAGKEGKNRQILPAGSISIAKHLTWTSSHDQLVHGLFYPPKNEDFTGLNATLPPLILMVHGGPSACASSIYNASVQFFTSRGFAVMQLNYRGSTGYGRAFRQALNNNWGILDVEDCLSAVKYLTAKKLIDPQKVAISGGSAGGFTVLNALFTYPEIFTAGTSRYGVVDLELLAKDTHKFEARYLDMLVGPYPQAKDIYVQRSPISKCQGANAPVLLLQGLQDPVVPANQVRLVMNELDAAASPYAFISFNDEGHGFKQPANVETALKAELSFYAQLWDLPLNECDHMDIEIFNL